MLPRKHAPPTSIWFAIGLPGYAPDPPPIAERTVIVHAWQDAVVPETQVTAYARYHQTELHLVNSDHRLTSAVPFIRLLFQEFLESFIPE